MTSDIGQRVNFDVSFDETFDSDFPAQFYVDSCTVTDESTGKVWNIKIKRIFKILKDVKVGKTYRRIFV